MTRSLWKPKVIFSFFLISLAEQSNSIGRNKLVWAVHEIAIFAILALSRTHDHKAFPIVFHRKQNNQRESQRGEQAVVEEAEKTAALCAWLHLNRSKTIRVVRFFHFLLFRALFPLSLSLSLSRTTSDAIKYCDNFPFYNDTAQCTTKRNQILLLTHQLFCRSSSVAFYFCLALGLFRYPECSTSNKCNGLWTRNCSLLLRRIGVVLLLMSFMKIVFRRKLSYFIHLTKKPKHRAASTNNRSASDGLLAGKIKTKPYGDRRARKIGYNREWVNIK